MEQCPICLCDIGEKNRCVTECGHSFCLNCILRAAQENTACPMCRKVLVEPSKNTHSQEDINAVYEHGRDEGYEEGRLDAAIEVQEEHNLERQKAFDEGYEKGQAEAEMEDQEEISYKMQSAFDEGFKSGRSSAYEEIRKLREQIKKLKNQDVKKPVRPLNPYMYFKSHPDNQKLIEEAAKVINLETDRPLGKVKAAGMLWSRLSDERKQEWTQLSIANFNAGVRT